MIHSQFIQGNQKRPLFLIFIITWINGELKSVPKIMIILKFFGHTFSNIQPFLQKLKNEPVGSCYHVNSFLAKNSDFVIYTYVEKEACPNNLAPTTSTSVQLAMGDAIAMSLLSLNKINSKDFAELHPGGQIGKSLTMKLGELINKNEKPIVNHNDKIQTVINEISSKRLGATVVVKKNKIKGIITDGDLRRMLQTFNEIKNISAETVMTKNPIGIDKNELAAKALSIMNNKKITSLCVYEKKNKFKTIGVLHIHNILQSNIS